MTSKLKFHTAFTIAEAENLLQQAEAKRDELDKQYGSLVEGIPWFSKHELQPKRPYRTVGFYLKQLQKVHADIQQLEYAIDEATRGQEAITSEKMWELAERMGLKYPQLEAQHE